MFYYIEVKKYDNLKHIISFGVLTELCELENSVEGSEFLSITKEQYNILSACYGNIEDGFAQLNSIVKKLEVLK